MVNAVMVATRRRHPRTSRIAAMATRILRDDFGCFRGQEQQIDVKQDVHLVRVFRRLGIIDGNSANEAIRTARRLNPEFPGELDWPAWWIGQKWCHPTEPNCARCPLTGDCANRADDHNLHPLSEHWGFHHGVDHLDIPYVTVRAAGVKAGSPPDGKPWNLSGRLRRFQRSRPVGHGRESGGVEDCSAGDCGRRVLRGSAWADGAAYQRSGERRPEPCRLSDLLVRFSPRPAGHPRSPEKVGMDG